MRWAACPPGPPETDPHPGHLCVSRWCLGLPEHFAQACGLKQRQLALPQPWSRKAQTLHGPARTPSVGPVSPGEGGGRCPLSGGHVRRSSPCLRLLVASPCASSLVFRSRVGCKPAGPHWESLTLTIPAKSLFPSEDTPTGPRGPGLGSLHAPQARSAHRHTPPSSAQPPGPSGSALPPRAAGLAYSRRPICARPAGASMPIEAVARATGPGSGHCGCAG